MKIRDRCRWKCTIDMNWMMTIIETSFLNLYQDETAVNSHWLCRWATTLSLTAAWVPRYPGDIIEKLARMGMQCWVYRYIGCKLLPGIGSVSLEKSITIQMFLNFPLTCLIILFVSWEAIRWKVYRPVIFLETLTLNVVEVLETMVHILIYFSFSTHFSNHLKKGVFAN